MFVILERRCLTVNWKTDTHNIQTMQEKTTLGAFLFILFFFLQLKINLHKSLGSLRAIISLACIARGVRKCTPPCRFQLLRW